MSKRLVSIVLSIIMLLTCVLPISAYAQSYKESLIAAGFPTSYVDDLVELHKKYPNWQFKPLKTNLSWSNAVKGERTPHSNQRVQMLSDRSSDYYCKCSNCYRNGNYVVFEGNSWVGASESTVKYYLDPRNWLDEKTIFQFESTAYDSSQKQTVVESIIGYSWMANQYITYKDPTLQNKTYRDSNGNKVKYSKAIMDAAKNSNMSAYYLATKIVQETGAAQRTAGGVVGTHVPFTGIYNFYSIGANAGADDGLAWAAGYLKALNQTYLYSKYDSTTKKASGTKTTVANGQYMCWMQTCGNFYKVRLYNQLGPDRYSKDGKIGYIKKSACRTTYFNYGRPWTNPYKAIYYGAEVIENGYSKYQYTDYLQKFNVLNVSGNYVHSHEYMTNIDGAVSEAYITHSAYNRLKILSEKKIFYIPVYTSMPATKSPKPGTSSPSSTKPSKVTGLKASANSTNYISLKWNKIAGATGYYVYKYNSSKKTYTKIATTSSTSCEVSKLKSGTAYSYAVAAYNEKGTGSKSSLLKTATKPLKVASITPTTATNHTITARWRALSSCTGYKVQYSRQKDFSNVIATVTVKPKSSNHYVGKNFTRGVKFYVRVRAYKTVGSKTYYGSWSNTKSIIAK